MKENKGNPVVNSFFVFKIVELQLARVGEPQTVPLIM
tara:strand:- start:379 stop:489 length:111 start_codon:yes stop_codon:yes gene_type:complete